MMSDGRQEVSKVVNRSTHSQNNINSRNKKYQIVVMICKERLTHSHIILQEKIVFLLIWKKTPTSKILILKKK